MTTTTFASPSRLRLSRRLRVLQVGKFYLPQRGGMETHLADLCNGLSGSVEVEAVVANHSKLSRKEIVGGIPVERLGTLCNVAGASVCPGLIRKIRRSDADLVHIHLPNPTAILSFLASGHAGPLVVSYHSDIVRQKFLNHFFEPVLHLALNRCATIIAASPAYIETSPVLSRHRARCRVIPYGVNLAECEKCDPTEVEAIRRAHGPRMLLTVARLVYYKGLEYLIRAMKQVDARLLIAGEGPLRDELKAEAEQHNVADRVRFLGRVTDVMPYYHAADLFVLPSVARSEAFGIVQLEAMACGKPVVNTRLPSGVPFVSLDGQTGISVPPRDTDALACAINALLDDEDRRQAYGRAARQRVEREFTTEVMLTRTLAVYAEAMNARHPARSWDLSAAFGV